MISGIILVNKPLGYTSRDVVNAVGKALGTRKIGHTGTLDPNASGVMVLCVGKALKICELLMNHDKEYVAQVILGIATDTLDTDKNATVLREEKVSVDKDTIIKTVESFKGPYLQEVPIYSSVKVNGRKLYEYARENIQVDLPKKEVEIKSIEVIGDIEYINDKTYFDIRTTVSKGTYIRALIRDIGKRLDSPAVMNTLTRTRLGQFSIDECYTLDDIKSGNYKLISILDVFDDIPIINVDDEIAIKVRNGMSLYKLFDTEMAFLVDQHGELLALYKNTDNKSKPYKMFV